MNDHREIRPGIVKAFDGVTYTATIQLTGSLPVYLRSVPVARNIAGADMTAGRRVALAILDPVNPQDCVVVAVWT